MCHSRGNSLILQRLPQMGKCNVPEIITHVSGCFTNACSNSKRTKWSAIEQVLGLVIIQVADCVDQGRD